MAERYSACCARNADGFGGTALPVQFRESEGVDHSVVNIIGGGTHFPRPSKYVSSSGGCIRQGVIFCL